MQRLVEHDVTALGTERHAHPIGENPDPAQHPVARIDGKSNVLGSHFDNSVLCLSAQRQTLSPEIGLLSLSVSRFGILHGRLNKRRMSLDSALRPGA
jgi:hypothetical protein